MTRPLGRWTGVTARESPSGGVNLDRQGTGGAYAPETTVCPSVDGFDQTIRRRSNRAALEDASETPVPGWYAGSRWQDRLAEHGGSRVTPC